MMARGIIPRLQRQPLGRQLHFVLLLGLLWVGVVTMAASAEAEPVPPLARDFGRIDAHALAAPDSATRSMLHLVRYLNEGASDDVARARAIYRWITANVEYDYEAYRSGKLRSTNLRPDDVLRLRKTICDGYSRLFEALASLAGIPAVQVDGYVASLGPYGSGALRYGGGSNHAWNAVKLEGRWYLLDPTWGASAEAVDQFFLVPPERMIRTHFPADPKWQLLEPHLTIADYRRQVLADKTFIKR